MIYYSNFSEKIKKVRRHATALLGRSMPRYDCGAIAATKIANLLYNIPPPFTLPYSFPVSLKLLNSPFFPSDLWGRLTHFFSTFSSFRLKNIMRGASASRPREWRYAASYMMWRYAASYMIYSIIYDIQYMIYNL